MFIFQGLHVILTKNGSICHLYPLVRMVTLVTHHLLPGPSKKTTLNIGIFGLCKFKMSHESGPIQEVVSDEGRPAVPYRVPGRLRPFEHFLGDGGWPWWILLQLNLLQSWIAQSNIQSSFKFCVNYDVTQQCKPYSKALSLFIQ